MKIGPHHRFRSLDSLRGIAALIVVVHHLVLSLPDSSQRELLYINSPLVMGGRFAVMLFFVLSGFVLALPYFAGKPPPYGPYLVRRFFRLYPSFAFAVLVSALLCYLLGGPSLPTASSWLTDPWSKPVTADVLISHLLMTGIHWDRSIGLDTPIWSLIIEMRVSLIFPLLVLYIRRFGWAGVAAALFASFICSKSQAALGEVTDGLVGESLAGALLLTGRYVALFLLGVVMAARLDRIKAMCHRISPKLHATIVGGMVCVWMMLAYTKAIGPHRGFVDVFSGVFTMYLIALFVAFPRVSDKLSGGFCLWLGDISYSLYPSHMPVLMSVFYLLSGRMPLIGIIAISLPATLIAGHLMHHLIERPSMMFGRKLTAA